MRESDLQGIVPSVLGYQYFMLIELLKQKYQISGDKLVLKWKNEWINHHQNVQNYFKRRPNDLLVFNIEKDNIRKLVEFLRPTYYLNPNLYEIKGKTNIFK